MNAAALPAAPAFRQARPIAEKAGLRPHILLNCRVWLAANESHPFFNSSHEALRTRGGVSHLREYFTLMFKQASALKAGKDDKTSDSLLHQAKAVLEIRRASSPCRQSPSSSTRRPSPIKSAR